MVEIFYLADVICVLWVNRPNLICQGLLLNSGLLLGLLKSQTQLLLSLCVATESGFFGLTGSAGICFMKICQLPDDKHKHGAIITQEPQQDNKHLLVCGCDYSLQPKSWHIISYSRILAPQRVCQCLLVRGIQSSLQASVVLLQLLGVCLQPAQLLLLPLHYWVELLDVIPMLPLHFLLTI